MAMEVSDAISDQLIDKLIGDGKTAEELFGKEGLVSQLTKRLIDRSLSSEITHHLGYNKHSLEGNNTGNSRNGSTPKTVKTGTSELTLSIPRDRNGEFEPQLVKTHQRRFTGFDDLVLSLYGKGMTVRDIQAHLEETYGSEVSKDLISTITDGILDEVKEWRNRPLEAIYPIVYIDGFVAKCRVDRQVSNRTVYVIYGINLEGHKEVLGLYAETTEGAKYWLSVLTELKNRGLEDIFILCADGLTGLSEAVEAAFPKTIFQTCIVHKVRSSLKYVSYKDKKAVAGDLKKIYRAPTLALAEQALDDFEAMWGNQFAAIVRSWRRDWAKIIPFFDYSPEIRRVIYTTNIIESLNRTLRKAVKVLGHFPTEDALMKVLYLSIKGVSKKWTMPIANWGMALNQFSIQFAERFPDL
jgi:putative transposase